MNDQELPESGTDQNEPEAAQQSPVQTPVVALAQEPIDELSEDSIDEDEFDDEEFLDDEETDDEEVSAVEQARSLMEELFEDEDFGEPMSELDVLTLEDAADYLKVEYGAIRRLVKEQGLPGRKIGEEWRFLRGAIADWLRAPGGVAAPAAPDRQPAQAEQRPERQDRREFTPRPAPQERFQQGEGNSRYSRQGSRYPQQGESSRYPQESRPPRRPRFPAGQNEGEGQGGYQGGYQSGGQGSYPPPRRPRYGNDQNQQAPQGEYRPPRRPPIGGGNFDNQSGGNFTPGGSYGGNRFNGGPKKPKRKAMNEQRFKRLDRRKSGDQADGGDDFDGDEG